MKKTLLILSACLCLNAIAFSQARSVISIAGDSISVSFVSHAILPTDTVYVTIVGDVMMHQAQIDNSRSRYVSKFGEAMKDNPYHYDFTSCLTAIKGILESADICIANMEFTHAGTPFKGYPSFSAPDSYSDYVASCGVDVFLMANNHILDGGSAGALRTIRKYERMRRKGVVYTGCFADEESLEGGYPLIIKCRGLKIGIVNFTYGTNVEPEGEFPKVCCMDEEEVAAAMRTAKDSADIVLAIPHWGTEYALRHSKAQEEVADFLLRHGADAIIGGHPHVVQDVETRDRLSGRRVPVVYSLGNIISNMSAENTQIGLIVTLPIVSFSDGSSRVGEPQYTLTWCSLPGGLTDCHATIPVRDYIGRRSEWTNSADYDKMMKTYYNIINTSGIQE